MKFLLEKERDTIINAMKDSMDKQKDPYIGPFWYDPIKNELYGCVLTLASDVPFYYSGELKHQVRTGRALHKNIWQKEHFRGKDSRFKGDYTLKPRGRVFEIKDKGFVVFVGSWINKYPDAKQLILFEFQLPEDTEFTIDRHWEIGHGWSEEY